MSAVLRVLYAVLCRFTEMLISLGVGTSVPRWGPELQFSFRRQPLQALLVRLFLWNIFRLILAFVGGLLAAAINTMDGVGGRPGKFTLRSPETSNLYIQDGPGYSYLKDWRLF